MTEEVRQETTAKPRSPLHDENGKFVKGNPGGPGRPRGMRDQLEYDFINAVQKEFALRGLAALSQLEAKELCDVAVKCLPKESRVDLGDTFSDLLRRADELVSQRGG